MRKQLPSWGQGAILTLLVYPVLFVLLSSALLYMTVIPVIKPYLGLAGLFISNTTETALPRDLFAARAPSATPDSGVSEGSKGNVDSETPSPEPSVEPPVEMIPLSSFIRPNTGDLYGRLTVEGTNIDASIYWGDSSRELNAGIGTYTGGWLPGFGRTIMMAGHRDSYLRDLQSAEIGGIITVETHYETYTYEIVDIVIYHMDDESGYDFTRKEENLILYTCYPFNYVGRAKQRYFVYAMPVSGKPVDRLS